MREFEYNGKSLPFDIGDIETEERFEEAVIALGAAEKTVPKDGKLSERMRATCLAFYQFFDAVLGEGAAMDLLGEKLNYNNCEECYYKLLETVKAQRTETEERRAKYAARYSPARSKR
jgi:hypothetical protein